MLKNIRTYLLACAALTLCALSAAAALVPDSKSEVNSLTPAEKAAGWKLLFDGRTTQGWRGFHQDKFPASGWTVKDGCLMHVAGAGAQSQQGGDIITADQYENFELQLEWRLAPGGNSGVKYFINESLPPTGLSGVGFEMQVLDDERHPDAKLGRNGNRTAGALYDLIAPSADKRAKPAGEFNQARLVVAGNRVEHWLNNVKVVEYQLGSEDLRRLIAESKYKDIADFGKSHKGHILLQDHGDEVCYRNIKIRELTADGRPVKR